jgi:hypothetical protein
MLENQIQYSAQFSMSNTEYDYLHDSLYTRIEDITGHKLVFQLFRNGIAPHIEFIEKDNYKQWRADLIICTPNEFWQIVNSEVQRIIKIQ